MTCIRALTDIGLKPTVTNRDTLTIARRVCRHMCVVRDEIRHQRRELRRKARKLRQFEPFTKLAADTLEQQARDHRAVEWESVRRVLLGYGGLIALDREGIADALGFEALADLLNINRVDREQARREGWRTLSDLVAIHDLESSAERRGRDWGEGSPLYEAAFLAMIEFIRAAPEDALPDPFGPNGPFYGAPVRVLNPDGTVTMKRPDLVVHDASGARVVKR